MSMTEQFSECHAVNDSKPIRQGDIFEWKEQRDDQWRKLGIIVTTDCDIAHAKHQGILSYVPLLDLRDYLALYYLPNQLKRGCSSLRKELMNKIQSIQTKYVPDFPEPISEKAALRWVQDTPTNVIANELQCPAGKERERFIALAADYVAVEQGFKDGSYTALFDAIVRLRMRQNNQQDQVTTKLSKDIGTFLSNLPRDAFFIANVDHQYRGGYIAYLRLVREIAATSIAIKYPDLKDSSVHAKRIAALSSPYIYRLTQQLAEVFAAIGLPNEYEESRKEALKPYRNSVTTSDT